MYYAYITRIKNLHKHPNADRLQIGECFGNSVVVSMEYEDSQIGIYFPSDGQLSIEYAEANNLLRKKDENGNNIGGYMDAEKRNVTAIKLRGEKSDGLFLPLKSLETFGDISSLNEGDRIDTFNGHLICQKYIPRSNHKQHNPHKGKPRKQIPVAPLFAEHKDTAQLAYNLGAFKSGDEIEITLKMHGTSQRTAYLPVHKGYKRSLIDRILRKSGTPIYEYDYISGTRRVVLEDYDSGFYGSNLFREKHHKTFVGKLMKGETVYYEVVGFTDSGKPIMNSCNNEKLGKEFIKQYGVETVFSYGCIPSSYQLTVDNGSDIYVYRMTLTTEEGFVVEYTPDFMRYRCEQIGVKCVPVFEKFTVPYYIQLSDDVGSLQEINAGEYVKYKAEKYYDGADPVGKTHIREGVVVRILNRPQFTAFKHKNFSFKVLEGIIKDTADSPDMEEIQETTE